MSKDKVIGVLNVSRNQGSEVFTTESMHVVTSFAGQLGIVIENARLYTDLEGTFLGTISALAAAVDAKDHLHLRSLDRSHNPRDGHRRGTWTRDRGTSPAADCRHPARHRQLWIDGAILMKPGRLTAEERSVINRHPAIGADILAPLDFLREMVPYVLFHHERYGGGGYPSGISGEAIPLGARIISVADWFNAVRTWIALP